MDSGARIACSSVFFGPILGIYVPMVWIMSIAEAFDGSLRLFCRL